jgi:RecB family exonuclease/superfamily I DNA/RNA helicase
MRRSRLQLFIAPAGAGKTAHAVGEARRHAQSLTSSPRVLVASALQAQTFRRRLGQAGGAIGVRVITFEDLYLLCLSMTDTVCCRVSDSVQHRIIRSVVRELDLAHYAPLTDQPGFIQVLKGVIDELKAGRVKPASFAAAVDAQGDPARLRELADIYTAYQARLQAEGWADEAGLGWLTVDALADDACPVGTDWPLLLVDGFDDFTPVQLEVLALMADRVGRTVITLTGSVDGRKRSLAHDRFERTRRELGTVLGVEPAPLPEGIGNRAGALTYLEARLFEGDADQMDAGEAVELIEAPNHAEEVRAALRWLKGQVVERGVSLDQLALLARDVAPYRPFVRQIAAEFGLPVHTYAGQPLAGNPAVAALMDLLRLTLPAEPSEGAPPDATDAGIEPALPPRLVIDAWRCPYFDWSARDLADDVAGEDDGAPIGIQPGDADALGVVARRGRVIRGLSQWEAAFAALEGVEAGSPPSPQAGGPEEEVSRLREDEEGEAALTRLTGQRVRELRRRFEQFVHRIQPPQGRRSARDFVRWVETLTGPDPEMRSDRFGPAEAATSLGVVARARASGEGEDGSSLAQRDVAALRCLKGVMRGLVWAEEALEDPPVTFAQFLQELSAGVEAAVYRVPRRPDRQEILVASVTAARGVAYRAVAVLGLAEGLFPETKQEDPLLWDSDRDALDLGLEPSTRSAEAEYFYETVAAPWERLLLTRPRLTDDGAPWEPSPFWKEIQRLVDVEPIQLATVSGPPAHRAASRAELFLSAGGTARLGVSARPGASASQSSPAVDRLWWWLGERYPAAVEALDAAARVFAWRGKRADSPFDGGLHAMEPVFTARFGVSHTWSASRLEAYRTCPFFFFVSRVLDLEPREEPAEGIDWLQRGNLYHKILEEVYQAVDDPTDVEQLLAALPAVADALLDEAPERRGFRPTAWWAETRREMVEDVRRSLEALSAEDLRGDFIPTAYEAAFGLGDEPPLVVRDPASDETFQLRGLIDRVDRAPEGGVRVIDYKTGGPSSYRKSAIRDGEKLQLPLYALAARDALGLGQPLSGFYWHVRHAEPSPFKLEDYGPTEAMEVAVGYAWEAIRGARAGRFPPEVLKGACPPYCPAVGFCWRYQPRYR